MNTIEPKHLIIVITTIINTIYNNELEYVCWKLSIVVKIVTDGIGTMLIGNWIDSTFGQKPYICFRLSFHTAIQKSNVHRPSKLRERSGESEKKRSQQIDVRCYLLRFMNEKENTPKSYFIKFEMKNT